jgi:ParB/RepB/Spo0J family partition protein
MTVQKISLEQIEPNPNQPRKHFTDLEELAESMRAVGQLTPVLVRPRGGRFELIHGERRWRAAKLAGLLALRAEVREASDAEAFLLAVVENVQRADLSPVEEGRAFAQLQGQGVSQADIARAVGKTQSYVSHKIALLALPEPLPCFLECRALTENHARQIARLKGIYGEGLLRRFDSPEHFQPMEGGHDTEVFLNVFRPEEMPPLFARRLPFETACPAVVVEGADRFAEYVSKHTLAPPQWAVAGFWWACQAVLVPLTVLELAGHIDRWRDRFESAATWWNFHGRSADPNGRSAKEYWAFRADLEHSGALTLAETMDDPEGGFFPQYTRILERPGKARGWIMPSLFQWETTHHAAAAC